MIALRIELDWTTKNVVCMTQKRLVEKLLEETSLKGCKELLVR